MLVYSVPTFPRDISDTNVSFSLHAIDSTVELDTCVRIVQEHPAWAKEQVLNLVSIYIYLGGGLKYFLFSPLPGEMIHFD